jgi:membrane protease YdiL (CAAX protease family)
MQLNNQSREKIGAIVLFYIIALALRYYLLNIKPLFYENIHIEIIRILLRGIGPLVGGLFAVYVLHRPFLLTLLGKSQRKSIVMVIIPVILSFITDIVRNNNSFSMTYAVVTFVLYALFEEYGWRGYLQSELTQIGKWPRILMITILWFLWHLNFSLSAGNLIFFGILLLGSWGIGEIAVKSNSLVACACFHSTINILGANIIEVSSEFKFLIVGICVIMWIIILFNQQVGKLIEVSVSGRPKSVQH